MQLKTVSATYGRKLNLGDYNSAHVEISLFADLDDGDDEAEAAEALRQMARHHVMAELARLQPALQAKVEGVFMGLPTDVQRQVQPVDEHGIPYTTDVNGARNYRGKDAVRALENDLKELDRKHDGGY